MTVMTDDDTKKEKTAPGGSDAHKRQRNKNIALALAIGGFCLLVYVVSLVRMSGG